MKVITLVYQVITNKVDFYTERNVFQDKAL